MPNEWISVKDRLPKKSGEYLTFTYAASCQVLMYSQKHKLFNSHDSNTKKEAAHFAIIVTHWMPLPEPPKEGENNA